MSTEEYSLVHVLRILKKWQKSIFLFAVIATLGVAVFSWFFLDNYFLSYARFYPVNLAYSDRSAMFSESGVTVPFYGDKEDVNRVLTIAQSAELAQRIIDQYHLAAHYDIDTTKQFWRTKVKKELESNFKVLKTEQGAVEISSLDTDPKLAREIVEYALKYVDETNKARMNESKRTQITMFDKQILMQQERASEYGDSMAKLGKRFNITVKTIAGSTVVEGNDFDAVQTYKMVLARQKSALDLLNNMTEIKEQIMSSLEAGGSSLSVLEAPFEADRKEKPKRSIFVITALLLSLAAGIFGALGVEEYKKISAQL
jgi:uncharacterized protein involved in exopolysaccharide biosynthesis